MHQSQLDLLEQFEHAHLPAGIVRETSHQCSILAHKIAVSLEYTDRGAELTAGLRKLMEAKDCFVRAALRTPDE